MPHLQATSSLWKVGQPRRNTARVGGCYSLTPLLGLAAQRPKLLSNNDAEALKRVVRCTSPAPKVGRTLPRPRGAAWRLVPGPIPFSSRPFVIFISFHAFFATKAWPLSHDGLHPPCRLARVWPGSADGGLRWKRHHSYNRLRYNVTARLGRKK